MSIFKQAAIELDVFRDGEGAEIMFVNMVGAVIWYGFDIAHVLPVTLMATAGTLALIKVAAIIARWKWGGSDE